MSSVFKQKTGTKMTIPILKYVPTLHKYDKTCLKTNLRFGKNKNDVVQSKSCTL